MVWSKTVELLSRSPSSEVTEGLTGVVSSSATRRSICDRVYLWVVIVCSRGELYATRLAALSWRRREVRLGEMFCPVEGDRLVVNGGKGELRRMDRRDRGWV